MFSTVFRRVFQSLFKWPHKVSGAIVWGFGLGRSRHKCAQEKNMSTKKSGRTLFTLVIEKGEARPRKSMAPAARPHADQRRKPPRRRPDYLAE